MDEVEVSTVIYVPPDTVYEFVTDFPRYANYSKYLTDVETDGDGGPGTRYDLHFAWWKVSYTARSEVVDVDPPDRLDWKLVKDITARGAWVIEDAPEAKPDDEAHATRARLRISFDADSAREGAIDLPRLVSLDWVIEKAKPLVLAEAERIVERMVADLEGEPRPVDLEIHQRPDL